MDQERLQSILAAASLTLPPLSDVEITGHDPVIATPFPAGEAAATALSLEGAAAAELWRMKTGRTQSVRVDVRAAAASLLSFAFQRLDGQPTPRPAETNPLVALYECADGRWIHLHGAFPSLRAGTLAVLECEDDRDSVAAAVRRWKAQDLEDALAARDTCGAMIRTSDEWLAHPQGQALADLPVVEIIKIADSEPVPLPAGDRPLSGIRALDLTRVLAGPTCGRTLASHGADVMLVNSPSLPNIPPFVLDTSHGKLSTLLDLDDDVGREQLRALVTQADVFAQGYRSGALARRGFAIEDLVAMRSGIIYVSINCYGHTGPWDQRPGWEQLAQSATGIAARHGTPEKPALIPAAACDYTTGYLAAYGVMTTLARRATEGGSYHVRASLAQTGMWLSRIGADCDPAAATGPGDISAFTTSTRTHEGTLTHLAPVTHLSETQPRWLRPTPALGAHAPVWP
jgi:crotonobetainyl-CoA:carnitine CoA-transferase CaiB-like acyl-CoA transferase